MAGYLADGGEEVDGGFEGVGEEAGAGDVSLG